MVVSIADFGSQSDLSKSFYEESELSACFSLACTTLLTPIDAARNTTRTGVCIAEDNDIVGFHVCLGALVIVLEGRRQGRR